LLNARVVDLWHVDALLSKASFPLENVTRLLYRRCVRI